MNVLKSTCRKEQVTDCGRESERPEAEGFWVCPTTAAFRLFLVREATTNFGGRNFCYNFQGDAAKEI